MIRCTLSTLTKHTMGRVRRRTSTKQRSITLVVRSLLRAQVPEKPKNDSKARAGLVAAAGPWPDKLGTSVSGRREGDYCLAPGFAT